jgi:hypothetical protein
LEWIEMCSSAWQVSPSDGGLGLLPSAFSREVAMNGKLLFVPIILGGVVVARRLLTPNRRERLSRLPGTMMKRCMDHMPEESPPKVLMAGVRRVELQNDEILTLLRDHHEGPGRQAVAR